MKKLVFNSRFLLAVIMLAFVSSCSESEEMVSEIEELRPSQESMMSITGNNDQVLDTEGLNTAEVVFHKSYSGLLTKEEALALWDEDVQNYMEQTKNGDNNERSSTKVSFVVATRTGSGTYHGTDGKVKIRLRYSTNVGNSSFLTTLDKFLYNDREPGNWDIYFLKQNLSNAVKELKINSVSFYLKGKDGWYLKDFFVHLSELYQAVQSNGVTGIWSVLPRVWLDNTTATGWDSYYSGNIGGGTIYF